MIRQVNGKVSSKDKTRELVPLKVEKKFLGIEESPNNILVGLSFVRRALFPFVVLDLAGKVLESNTNIRR